MVLFLQRLAAPEGQRQRRRKLLETFNTAYGHLTQPIALCEGFEIVTANKAFMDTLHIAPPVRDTMMIDRLPTLDEHEYLFGPQGGTTLIYRGDKSYHLNTCRWPLAPHTTLVELTDLSAQNDSAHALERARIHDPQTGLILPGPFQKYLATLLAHNAAAWLGIIRLPDTRPTVFAAMQWNESEAQESRTDLLIALSDRLRHDLGSRTLLGLGPCQRSVMIAAPMTGDDASQDGSEEGRHILRQLAQISRRCLQTRHGDVPPAIALTHYPTHAKTAPELLQTADLTLINSEQQAEPVVFDAKFTQERDRHAVLTEEFPHALATGAIVPHFQPIIHAGTGVILGFEALIRWIHPELGYVIPPDIVAIARSRKMLASLTYCVVQHCVREMARWPERMSFAINVLPEQLTGELVDMMRETVRGARIDPARLEIEITEDALIENFDRSARIIARLRAIGLSVAMDDFGAGFTSLSNLTRLEVTKVKIDKSLSDGLPHQPRSGAVVRSILYLAKELDIAVTVEGIETEDQLAFLYTHDCGVQGYVHSRPLPARDLIELSRFLAPGERVADTEFPAMP